MKTVHSIIILLSLSLSIYNPISAQLTQELESKFQQVLDKVIVNKARIGISASVKIGDQQWASALGRNFFATKLDTDHQFGIGSTTKTITSACILSMWDEGLLTLDDPMGMYLPEYANADASITIRQLLNHTSGIFNYTNHPLFEDEVVSDLERIFSVEEIFDEFVKKPSFEVGTKQEYSNTNYLLLGLIIEAVSGKKYHEEIRSRFNSNNQYPSLTYIPEESPVSDLAHLWADFFDYGLLSDLAADSLFITSLFSSAKAGGAYAATPSDMAQWGQDLYSGKLLSEKSMEALFDAPDLLLSGEVSYGLGVFIDEASCGSQFVGHGGNIVYSSALVYAEEFDMSISILSNDGEIGNLDEYALEMLCTYAETVTANKNIAQHEKISIRPNPFSDEISISLEGLPIKKASIIITNEIGQRVYSQDNIELLEKEESIHLPLSLPLGIYAVQIISDQGLFVQKICSSGKN